MREFLVRRWFLLLLVTILAAGILLPRQLALLSDRIPEDAVVAIVLFLMSLPLELRSMWLALRDPRAALLAIVINSLLLPLAAWGVSFGLSGDLAPGLIVAASVPCTLASAAVWTRKAGGNDAIAILVMVLTNLACFVVTPFWLVVATQTDVAGAGTERLSFAAMASKLALVVVAPIVAGQLCRLHRPLAGWATRRKVGLSVVAQCGILSIVLIGAVQSGLRLTDASSGSRLRGSDWALMLAAVIGLHVAALWLGLALAKACRLPPPDRIAVGFAGSQKTLMVGLHLAIGQFGALAMLPMVAFHVCQLLVDTLVADHFAARARAQEQPAPAGDEVQEPGS